MSRNSKRIWPYSSSRSPNSIDLGVNGKPIRDFLLVINCNFSRICYRFRDNDADRKQLILPTPLLFDAPSAGTPWDINVIYTPQKRTFNGLQFRRWHYGYIFIRLAVVASQIAKSREIPTTFYLTAFQGHPRSSISVSIESPCTKSRANPIKFDHTSSKVIDLGVSGKPICDFL